MKILYFSDTYADAVMGVKKSIYKELTKRRNTVIFQDKQRITEIFELTYLYKPDQIWLAHSGLIIPREIKNKIKVPIIGFGFSDPYYFSEERLKSYDVYITNHFWTFKEFHKDSIPVLYNPPACDLSFHADLKLKKEIDVSFIGVGKHIRFKNQNKRIDIIDRLRKETSLNIEVYGNLWNPHPKNFNHIEGLKFLTIINKSKVGLNIQDENSPLAHRIFEYGACGIPMITPDNQEIRAHFVPAREIIVYENYEELKNKLIYYVVENPDKLRRIGFHAKNRCIKDHNISNRIDKILNFLNINLIESGRQKCL